MKQVALLTTQEATQKKQGPRAHQKTPAGFLKNPGQKQDC
jgi:hypothetical protein